MTTRAMRIEGLLVGNLFGFPLGLAVTGDAGPEAVHAWQAIPGCRRVAAPRVTLCPEPMEIRRASVEDADA